jgi:hypothetical protein
MIFKNLEHRILTRHGIIVQSQSGGQIEFSSIQRTPETERLKFHLMRRCILLTTTRQSLATVY